MRDNFGELLECPRFDEDIDEQVATAMKLVGRVVATRDLAAPDQALTRLLATEARRRAKETASEWSFYKPLFDEPMYQRQLRIFNSIARALGSLYGKHEVRCEEEWVRNLGTLHFLALHLDFGPVSMKLGFLEPSLDRRNREQRIVTTTTLFVGSDKALAGMQQWSDVEGARLEAQLPDIVRHLLKRAEVTLRAAAQMQFEHRVKTREQERAAQEQRRRDEEAKRIAALEARRAKIRDEILEVARRRSVAADIRQTIDYLRGHPEGSGQNQARFIAWQEHALDLAAQIDPMNDSLNSIMGSFVVHELPTDAQPS